MSTQTLQPLIWLARSSTSANVGAGTPPCSVTPFSACSAFSASGKMNTGFFIRDCMMCLLALTTNARGGM
jgi:hypothetical protein